MLANIFLAARLVLFAQWGYVSLAVEENSLTRRRDQPSFNFNLFIKVL